MKQEHIFFVFMLWACSVVSIHIFMCQVWKLAFVAGGKATSISVTLADTLPQISIWLLTLALWMMKFDIPLT